MDRMTLACFSLGLFALGASVLTARASDEGSLALKERVVRELPAALARIDALYSDVSLSGTINEERWFASPPAGTDKTHQSQGASAAQLRSTSSRKYTLQESGGLRKIEQTLIFDKHYDEKSRLLQDHPATPIDPARSVSCLGHDYAFRIRWENDKPVLTSVDPPTQSIIDGIPALKTWHSNFLKAPAGFMQGMPMSRIMALPSFSVTKVVAGTGSSQGNAVVYFEFDVVEIPGIFRSLNAKISEVKAKRSTVSRKFRGWIEVSPEDGWAVRAYGPGHVPADPLQVRHEIVYGERRAGILVPSRITVVEQRSKVVRKLEVESIDFGPIPEREFTLAAYGLPEIDTSPRSRQDNSTSHFFFLGAIIAAIVAFALRYYAKRRWNGDRAGLQS